MTPTCNQYLERALEWLGVYKTPVILFIRYAPDGEKGQTDRGILRQKICPSNRMAGERAKPIRF